VGTWTPTSAQGGRLDLEAVGPGIGAIALVSAAFLAAVGMVAWLLGRGHERKRLP
jgi:hypothetical protein